MRGKEILTKEKGMWEIPTFFALFFTLLAVIWYACETRKLRMETIKQTELSLRPFVVITYDTDASMQRRFKIENIGKGPALNVKIADIPIMKKDGEHYIRYIFSRIDVIVPNEKKDIKGKIKVNEHSAENSFVFMSHFQPESVKSYDFIINYANINNNSYKTEGSLGKGGLVIEGTKKS